MDELQRLDFLYNLGELTDDLPVLEKYYCVAAKSLFSYYAALVRAGFTGKQAVQIVIAHGFNPESSSLGKGGTPLPKDM